MPSPKLFLAIPTMNPRLLDKALFNAWSRSTTHPHTLIWFNGMSYRDAHQAGLDIGHLRNEIDREILLSTDFSTENLGVPRALTKLSHMAQTPYTQPEDWILFIHDDVHIYEDAWDQKCLDWLSGLPNCRSFGFGGAAGLGDPDLYQKPYKLQQLARRGFMSNMQEAEAHGMRVTEPRQVGVLDGFSMAVRADFLTELDGWNWWPETLPHHVYDVSLGCQVRRYGWETWMLPISCHHLGGQTATKVNYQADFGLDESSIHTNGHTWLYNEFKDVLPLKTP